VARQDGEVRGLQEQLEWESSRRDELVNEAVGPVEREMTLALETVDQVMAHQAELRATLSAEVGL
jgi:hypothetical protein